MYTFDVLSLHYSCYSICIFFSIFTKNQYSLHVSVSAILLPCVLYWGRSESKNFTVSSDVPQKNPTKSKSTVLRGSPKHQNRSLDCCEILMVRCTVQWNKRFISWMRSQQICSKIVKLQRQYEPNSLRNDSSALLSLCHENSEGKNWTKLNWIQVWEYW